MTASGPVQAVYKPHRGEQSLWDFPDGLYRREVAAYRLSEALGWGLVPPTVLRDDGPFGTGSVQLFLEADYERHYFTLLEDGGREGELEAFCAFDVVANNADRKSGHVLVDADEHLWGIDHGLCFHAQPKLRTVIWDFAERGGARLDRRRPGAAGGRRTAGRPGGTAVVGGGRGGGPTGRAACPRSGSSPNPTATVPPTPGRWSDRTVPRPGSGDPARGGSGASGRSADAWIQLHVQLRLDGGRHRGGQAGPAPRGQVDAVRGAHVDLGTRCVGQERRERRPGCRPATGPTTRKLAPRSLVWATWAATRLFRCFRAALSPGFCMGGIPTHSTWAPAALASAMKAATRAE